MSWDRLLLLLLPGLDWSCEPVWVFALWIQSHDSLPACLVQDPTLPPSLPPTYPSFSLSTPRCPLSLQPHPLLRACLPAFNLLYHLSLSLSPGAEDERARQR